VAVRLGGDGADREAVLCQQLPALREQAHPGDAVVFLASHADEAAQVPQPGGAQQGFDNDMADHVAVGMSLAAICVPEEQSGHPAGLAGLDLVGVGGDTDAGDNRLGHGCSFLPCLTILSAMAKSLGVVIFIARSSPSVMVTG